MTVLKNKIENDEREDVNLPPFKIYAAIAERYQTYVENFISNLVFGPYSVSQANRAILEALHAIATEAKDKQIPLSSCQEYIQNHNLSNIYQVQEIMLKICCKYVENLYAMTENKNYILIEI